MANTYTLIASTSLTGSQASVVFSAIPATYDDLYIQMSVRDTASGAIDTQITMTFNSIATGYSETWVGGSGSATSSGRVSSQVRFGNSFRIVGNGPSSTASTFASSDIYIPGYRVAQNKPISITSMQEANTTAATMSALAGLLSNTAAITSITLNGQTSFASGSTFWLYGIKNS